MNIVTRKEFITRLSITSKPNVLGLDIGTQYTGLAIAKSIFEGGTAKPLKTLPINPFDPFLKSLREVILKEEIGGMVIGWPLSDIKSSPFSATLKQYILKISSSFPNQVVLLQDESHSSMEAAGMLHNIDKSLSTQKHLIDQVAACIILSRFLTWLELHNN